MTVRKKVKPTLLLDDNIDLSRELQEVREVILNLPPEEGIMNEGEPGNTGGEATDAPKGESQTAPPAETAGTSKGKSTVKKKPAQAEKKKATKKAAVKKSTTKAAATDMVKLADLAKAAKLTPAAARRKLRDAEFKKDGQWAWPKGSAEIAKVSKILAASAE